VRHELIAALTVSAPRKHNLVILRPPLLFSAPFARRRDVHNDSLGLCLWFRFRALKQHASSIDVVEGPGDADEAISLSVVQLLMRTANAAALPPGPL